MDIATKADRIASGEDSQHGTHVAVLPDRPTAITRLRALLRGGAGSARAAEDSPYYPESATGLHSPATSPVSTAEDTAPRETAPVPRAKTVKRPAKKAAAKPAKKAEAAKRTTPKRR